MTRKKQTTRTRRGKGIKSEDVNIQVLMKELEFGLDIGDATLYLTSDVGPDTLYETISKMNFLRKMTKQKSLTLCVSSFGGDVYSMFGIHDFIRTFSMKVNTVCVGTAMSAAAFILSAGTGKRKMTRNSTVMFHQFTAMIEGKTHSALSNAEHIKIMQDRVNEILGIYTKKPRTYWDKRSREDFYLSSDECLELGVVDEIIET